VVAGAVVAGVVVACAVVGPAVVFVSPGALVVALEEVSLLVALVFTVSLPELAGALVVVSLV